MKMYGEPWAEMAEKEDGMPSKAIGLGKEREMIDGMSRRWHGGGTDAYGARAADKIES